MMKKLLLLVLLILIGCSKPPKDGPYKDYFDNGKIWIEYNLKDGKWDGPSKMYWYDGQLRMDGNWKDGEKDGLWKYYNENGQLEMEVNLKDGELIESKEYHNQITNNWMELKVWMTKKEVRELIGDPLSVTVSSIGEYWYYEDGQYVQFGYDGGVLRGWSGYTQ
jgi:antitoxin component YwqK of YwqJK toxin-antitoxin module